MLLVFFVVLAREDTSKRSRVRRLAILECVVLTIRAFFQTICFKIVPRYSSAMMQYERDRRGVTGPLD